MCGTTLRRVPLIEAAVRVLVVEDDQDIADLVAHHLHRAGYVTTCLASGDGVLSTLRANPPDLLVLDLMLPGQSGLEICRAIRAEPNLSGLPIIMLTAKSEEADRIIGLELGADDYVTKPFSAKELVARVGAVLRRADRSKANERMISVGPVLVDLERHLVTVNEREVRLTAKEFLLLKYLMEHEGRVLSRDLLLSMFGATDTLVAHALSTSISAGFAKSSPSLATPSSPSSSLDTSWLRPNRSRAGWL